MLLQQMFIDLILKGKSSFCWKLSFKVKYVYDVNLFKELLIGLLKFQPKHKCVKDVRLDNDLFNDWLKYLPKVK